MSFKRYLFLAKKNLFKKKINILSSFLLIIAMCITIFICSFSKTFRNFLDRQVDGNIISRMIYISSRTKDESDIQKVDGIEYVIKDSSNIAYTSTEDGNSLVLIGVPDEYVNVVRGKKLNQSSDDKILLCPKEIYIGNNDEEYNKDFHSNLHNGNEYLNKSLQINTGIYSEIYKIVGVYDNNKYSYGEYNICFTKSSNIETMYRENLEEQKRLCDDEVQDCEHIESEDNAFVALVKDGKKKNIIIEKIRGMGYYVSDIREVNISGIDFITKIFVGISIIVTILCFIILVISNSKFMQYNKKNNMIYKALGYDNKILIKVNYLESLLLVIISFILAIIIIGILYFIFSAKFYADIKTGMPLCISYISIILGFVFSLFTAFLATYISLKNDNSIVEALNDSEI